MEFVWYLSYGSNMCKERFNCYIHGGRYSGSITGDQGCKCNDEPIKEENIIINHELYFSYKASKWQNGGVGFISNYKNCDIKTYGKMYLLTKDQFEDVVKQENGIDVNDTINIDYDLLEKNEHFKLFPDKLYGGLLKVSQRDGHSIYTFTSPEDREESRKPSVEYLTTIFKGILMNYQCGKEEIVSEFIKYRGIRGNYTEENLMEIIQQIN